MEYKWGGKQIRIEKVLKVATNVYKEQGQMGSGEAKFWWRKYKKIMYGGEENG